MSDFFPDPPDVPEEVEVERPQPEWLGPPSDALPGVVPVELILGRSEKAVVMLTGWRAFAQGLAMTLSVRTRALPRSVNLQEEVFDGPYRHDQDQTWRRDRLKWGFEYADGRRATNIGPWPDLDGDDQTPDRPVLIGGGGGGGDRSTDRYYWLWPLPPGGKLTIVCEWRQVGIETTTTVIDADPVVAAAARSQEVWRS
ncbi:hypothetical protein GCM10023340_26460 [Nocardioides marinquilinus]|uniref:Uncharacterized protein n=1 Tax=Nocardioides marinquilinus TaxID=1210400 RepID=A0ABP9PST4_9ACTN